MSLLDPVQQVVIAQRALNPETCCGGADQSATALTLTSLHPMLPKNDSMLIKTKYM